MDPVIGLHTKSTGSVVHAIQQSDCLGDLRMCVVSCGGAHLAICGRARAGQFALSDVVLHDSSAKAVYLTGKRIDIRCTPGCAVEAGTSLNQRCARIVFVVELALFDVDLGADQCVVVGVQLRVNLRDEARVKTG